MRGTRENLALIIPSLGSAVAKYSGEHLHRLVIESKAYESGNYRDALKKGFLGIDEALRAG